MAYAATKDTAFADRVAREAEEIHGTRI
jgi:hypothetical protein